MSASWCLVSMYRIWILGSKLILSNNQSRTTMCVRETYLVVGLRPLKMIWITASLSSKTHNIALGPECVVFGGMWSMFVGMTLVCLIGIGLCMFGLTIDDGFLRGSLLGPSVLFGTEWNTSITKSKRVRAGIPSMRKPASTEMMSASVELCETEVCFWHKRVTSEKSQKSLLQNQSLERIQVCIVVLS